MTLINNSKLIKLETGFRKKNPMKPFFAGRTRVFLKRNPNVVFKQYLEERF